MTINLDSDPKAENRPLSLGLPFESTHTEMAGVRLLPAQLARVLGVSKQAVSTWVKNGRITLGTDGRVDPSRACADLLRTGDPRRLRLKILQPLVRDIQERDRIIGDLEERIAALHLNLEAVNGDADFHEQSAAGYLEIFDGLGVALPDAWPWLRERADGAEILLNWLAGALETGPAGLTLAAVAESLATALGESEEGDEEANLPMNDN